MICHAMSSAALLAFACLPAFVGIAQAEPTPEASAEGRASRPAETPQEAAPPRVPLTDVTQAAGVDFVHRSGASGGKLLPETMGGGVALFDFDGDHDADLLFVQSEGSPVARLYRNETPAGEAIRFVDVTAETGLDGIDAETFYGMGVAVGDVDADGDVDVFLTGVGQDRLLRNDLVEGTRRFVDVTEAAGVGGADDAWSSGAAFFDADVDGDLDLLVVRYVEWSQEIEAKLGYRLDGIGRAYGPPQEYGGTRPSLYLNRGDGTFVDDTEGSGLEIFDSDGRPAAKALAALPVDADLDGRMDVLVANDTVRNFFFRNLGPDESHPVRFEEVGEFYGLAYDRDGKATGAMGVDAGYYRNDANLGFLVGNYSGETSSILRAQDDPGFFVDEAMKEGLGAPTRSSLTFGAFFFDADLDGRLDVLHVNGHVEPDIAKIDKSQPYRQSGQLFWNSGETFVLLDDTSVGDLARPIAGRGAAYADLDGDGDLDVVATQIDGPPLVLRNDQAIDHRWLRVRLEPQHQALGARVELTAGGVTQTRQAMPTRSYLSQVESVATFGLGEAEKVESVKVIWPSGVTRIVEVEELDREMVVPMEERSQSRGAALGRRSTGEGKSGAFMKDELIELSHLLLTAIQERDAEVLDTILADDFRHFDSSGASLGKEAFVRGIVEAQYRILSIGFETLEVTSIDESAVVLGVQTAEVQTLDGEVLTSRSGFTDVFTRDGEAWVIRLAHSADP